MNAPKPEAEAPEHRRPRQHVANLLVMIFFIAVAGLIFRHGLEVLEHGRERERARIQETVRLWQQRQAISLEAAVSSGMDHASFFARLPDVLRVAEGEANVEIAREPSLQAYWGLHRGILALRVYAFESGSTNLRRVEVSRRGVETEVSRARETILAQFLEGERERLFPSYATITVAGEPLWDVLRLVAPVRRGSEVLGVVEVDVAARAVVESVYSLAHPTGFFAFLVDDQGRYLGADHEADEPGFVRDYPEASERILEARQAKVSTGAATLYSQPVGATTWRLVLVVPYDAMRAAVNASQQGWMLTLAPYALVALVIVAWGWLALGWNVRATRLAEAERTTARIEREHRKYLALLDGAADMILIVDPKDARVIECNANARELLQAREGLRVQDLCSEEHFRILYDAFQQAEREETQQVSVSEISAGAEAIPVDGRLALVDIGEERVVELSLRDLRERKSMEQQLQISERLSMLGMMTAGVAHEINNPLEGIGNYLVLLERGKGDEQKRQKYLASVRHGFERIRDIVKHFSTMVRPDPEGGEGELRRRRADLAAVVGNAVKLLSHTKNLKGIEVDLVGFKGSLPVAGDAGQLEQVFWNLLLNAGKAMAGEGRITIAARRLDDVVAGSPDLEVTVEDTGPGIPAEHLERIFDPFFTRAKGHGLGLYVSYGILSAHGGSLSAENRSEGGARFRLRLCSAGS